MASEQHEEQLGKFGHHPDPLIDAEVEIDRLNGLLCEAHGGLLRGLDYRAATPEGLSIKADLRDALRRTGFKGNMGYVGGPANSPDYELVPFTPAELGESPGSPT